MNKQRVTTRIFCAQPSSFTQTYFIIKYLMAAVFIIFSLINVNANANTTTYHIAYHKDSPIKSMSLNNTEVLIQFHRHGNSIGRLVTKTDTDQNIKFENTHGKHLVVHILSIKKAGHQIRCRGVSTNKTNTIKIKCH